MTNILKKLILLDFVKSLYNSVKDKIHRILFNNQINDNNLIITDDKTDIIKSQEQLLDDSIISQKETVNIELSSIQKENSKKVYPIKNMTSYLSKEELKDWIFEDYHSHFVTIQFPRNYRSENYDKSLNLLRKLMSRFEYHLLQSRYWNKKHVPFMAIAERGRSVNWHFHFLIDLDEYDENYIRKIILKTVKDMKMSPKIMHIRPFTKAGESYSTKEIEINGKKVRTDHIIPSSVLFNIPVKDKTPSIS